MNSDSQTEPMHKPRAITTSASKYRNLMLIALVYAAWLIWLLYVGLVNYQAGNQ